MIETIERLAQEVLAQHGINKNAKVEETIQKPSFEAFTDQHTEQTTLRYNPKFTLPSGSASFARKKNVTQPLETCVKHIMKHECGHVRNNQRQGCPETIDDYEESFYEPIAAVLARKNKLHALDSVCNLALDYIDNTLMAQGAHAGLSLFYKDVAATIGWQPAFEAYMRMQLRTWGDIPDKKLLTKHYSKNQDVIRATQAFLNVMKKSAGVAPQSSEMREYLANKMNWKTIATEFAKAIEPLIPEQSPFMIPMCAFGKMMQEQMSDPTLREQFARKKYTAGGSRPHWMTKEEALDAVYSSLAREIQVKVDAPRKAKSLPIVPYQHQAFNPEEHSLSQINFRKPMIVPEQETPFGIEALTFGVPEHHVEKPLLVKRGITSFPEFKCAYIDSSSSMKEGIPDPNDAGNAHFIPWGDKSKYHYLCKSWYGIIEYLARQQILPNVNVTLGAFSNTSRVRHGLEEAKKLLFSPQFGITQMSSAALDELMSGGKSVFFTVSDGEVQNWDAVKKDFISRAKEHYFFHIQIGKGTKMTQDLKRAGLPVYSVNQGADLERVAIDLTRNAYQSYIHETLEHTR
jgi:hypothetical protein